MLKTLRVGPIDYDVTFVPRLQADGESVNGYISHNACTVEVDAEMAPQTRAVTVWHETLHAILVQSGRVNDHDEELIDAIAYGIIGVLRDNPELRDVTLHV
jgi:hypothetical protein